MTRRMPDTWIACSLRCEAHDLELRIEEMESRIRIMRAQTKRLLALADAIDFSGEFAATETPTTTTKLDEYEQTEKP